jgi:hypothetical protein
MCSSQDREDAPFQVLDFLTVIQVTALCIVRHVELVFGHIHDHVTITKVVANQIYKLVQPLSKEVCGVGQGGGPTLS